MWTGVNAWKDEQSASYMQLHVGIKLGLSQNEQNYLRNIWAPDSNQKAMQENMTNGRRVQ
jgi:hypothetical protein